MDEKESNRIRQIEERIEALRESLQKERDANWPLVIGGGGFLAGAVALGRALDDGMTGTQLVIMIIGGVGFWRALKHVRGYLATEKLIAEDEKERSAIEMAAAVRLRDAREGGRRADD